MRKTNSFLIRLCYSSECLALCMVLPFFTAGNSELGSMLSPMHMPVLLCGVLTGPLMGGIVGFIAPIIRCFMFGAPAPFIPRALSMAVELFGYGITTGLFCSAIRKKFINVYPALIVSMLVGRILGGLTKGALLALGFLPKYGIYLFFSGYFIQTAPAIVIQLLLIPAIVLALKKAGVVFKGKNGGLL